MKHIFASIAWGVFAVFLLAGMGDGLRVSAQPSRVVADFERYEVGSIPNQWVRIKSRDDIRPAKNALESGERFEVLQEDENKFARLYTDGEYVRFSQRNGEEFEWDLNTHPRLQWRWRALTLPEGASEKGKNDTGGAVYINFGTDWLGRPKSIKYTYSSSLSVGTVVSFGPLKVIVVASAEEPRTEKWKTQTRNVVNDYQQIFGEDPPDRPRAITISGDSDSTGDESKVDFDDIKLLPTR